MRILLCVTLLGIAIAPVQAQVTIPDKSSAQGVKEQVFGLGVSASFASGIGLTFRHHLPGKVSWEATGGVIKVDDKMHYTVGGELQLDLDRGTSTRFFATLGLGYFHSAAKGQDNTLKGPGRLGLGIGGEVPVGSGFHATGKLLFTWFSDGTILPLPGLNIMYYFH